jgi:hypothetical protein
MKYYRTSCPLSLRSIIDSSFAMLCVRWYLVSGFLYSPDSAFMTKSFPSTNPICSILSLIQFEKSLTTSRYSFRSRALTGLMLWPSHSPVKPQPPAKPLSYAPDMTRPPLFPRAASVPVLCCQYSGVQQILCYILYYQSHGMTRKPVTPKVSELFS